jgi:hypothetical protein
MRQRLPPTDAAPQEALAAFWAERRTLARAARAGMEFSGATRPPRAAAERAWLITVAAAGGPPADRESATTLEAPQGRRRRRG